jgi:MATE family multidrug resistance protein
MSSQCRSHGQRILALAFPLILTQLASVALSTTDIVMMGLLGPAQIAAGGLGLALFNLLRTTAVGLITPISNVVATQQASVPSAHAPIARIARDGFVIATFSGLVCWGILLGIGPLLTALGQPAQIVLMTSDFLVGLAPGMLPLLWFQVLRNVSIGLKRPGPLVKITLLSVAANAILNYVLMFGVAGWQGMGLASAMPPPASNCSQRCCSFLPCAVTDICAPISWLCRPDALSMQPSCAWACRPVPPLPRRRASSVQLLF